MEKVPEKKYQISDSSQGWIIMDAFFFFHFFIKLLY